jgi:hypoxanthine phosphoribosyltransferase
MVGDREQTESARIEPLFDAAALRASVAELGARLTLDFGGPRPIADFIGDAAHAANAAGLAEGGGDEPLLLAILGGSLIFLADLVRAIDRPVRFELMQVGYSEGSAEPESGTPREAEGIRNIHYPIPVEIAERRVVVLKDVVASGVIEVYLAEQLRQHGAREVRFAALIDIPDARKTGFTVDYRAFTTWRDGILVGYGLKHEGRYGNLPYIGRLPLPG